MAILALWFVFVALLGLTVGSYLNVCIARLPYEKSLLWPLSSRCGSCLQPIHWYDNLPVVSYLLLRGRCRTCGARFSPRYLVVELGTALAFVGLFYLEMIANVLNLPLLRQRWGLAPGFIPPEATIVYFHHAILLAFLIAASGCDLMEMEIPLPITLWGTVVGLALAVLLPWPLPCDVPPLPKGPPAVPPYGGVYAWPIWYPLPARLPAASWQLGLLTGLAGTLAGMVVLRVIRFLFSVARGIEGLGVGDADLMMMAGAFLGWQPIFIAFLVGVFVGLFFAIGQLILRGKRALPFGPALSLGVIITVLCWPLLAPRAAEFFFEPWLAGGMAVAAIVSLLIAGLMLRLLG